MEWEALLMIDMGEFGFGICFLVAKSSIKETSEL